QAEEGQLADDRLDPGPQLRGIRAIADELADRLLVLVDALQEVAAQGIRESQFLGKATRIERHLNETPAIDLRTARSSRRNRSRRRLQMQTLQESCEDLELRSRRLNVAFVAAQRSRFARQTPDGHERRLLRHRARRKRQQRDERGYPPGDWQTA